MKRLSAVLGAFVLLGAGFAAGSLQDPPRTFKRHYFKPVTRIASKQVNDGFEFHSSEFPDLAGFSEEKVQALSYISSAGHIQKKVDGTGTIVVNFSNVEEWWLRWIDRIEKNGHDRMEKCLNSVGWVSTGFPTPIFPGIAVLPPSDGDASTITWVVQRWDNGRVKRITPFSGNVVGGKGLRHGVELYYDAEGNLTAMVPWVDGRRHGVERRYTEKKGPSRFQEPTTTRKWSEGRPVLERQVPKPRVPGPGIPRKKGDK